MSRLRQRSGTQGLLTSWLASPPPDAAVEISPERVAVATVSGRGTDLVLQGYASEPLPTGAVVPSLTAHNVIDRPRVVAALQAAFDRLGSRPRRIALIIPDLTARVALLRFDRVPSRREDLDQLVRWNLKKSAPFPIDDACVTYEPAGRSGDGHEFLVVMARREVVREYEAVCDEVGAYAGLVDLATLNVLNLFLASKDVPPDDWLVVHMQPEYTTLAIMRREDLIFYRSRPEAESTNLADLVHQTVMYYQDRLSGQGFSRVLLGGTGRVTGSLNVARQSLEERLGVSVEPVDPTRVASLRDRITVTPELMDVLAPLVGMLARTRRQAAAA
jgi:Tfp pilus assembly PilM family ATPase